MGHSCHVHEPIAIGSIQDSSILSNPPSKWRPMSTCVGLQSLPDANAYPTINSIGPGTGDVMAASSSQVAAFSLFLVAVTLTGCADTSPKAGPWLGDESRPAAVAAAGAATNLAAGTDGIVQFASRTLDVCAVEGDGSISNPSAPRAYSCDVYRVTLLAVTPPGTASEGALLIDESFAARACTVPAPLVTPLAQSALDALDAGSTAPPVRGGYDCSGEHVTTTFGRADNATIRWLAQTLPRSLSSTVVTEEPPIGAAPLDKVLDSGAVFVGFIQTKVNYVDTAVCGGLRLC